ncbi:MAG: polysaccharide biosynthesis protein [Clostridia bacterium]|nr:polysaccharide biosynthesis protein [Clostridia bacterium]
MYVRCIIAYGILVCFIYKIYAEGKILEKRAFNVGLFARRLILVAADAILINVSGFLFAVMSSSEEIAELLPKVATRALPVTLAYIVIFWAFGLYNSIWKYAGLNDLIRCCVAGVIGGMLGVSIDLIGSYFHIANMSHFDALFYVSTTLLIIALCGGFRVMYRVGRYLYRENITLIKGKKKRKRVMIVGAGDMGMIIVRELEANAYRKGKPVVIVDDNVRKQGQKFCGIPVRGGCDRIPEIAKKFMVDEIIYCIPSATNQRQREIMNIAMQTECTLKKCPTLREMTSNSDIQKIKNVDICDLLSRPEVDLNIEQCKYIEGKTVIVTGCGSIGSEICRQVAKHSPKQLVLVDNYENNAFDVYNELERIYKDKLPLFIRIGSVQDPARLAEIFSEFNPDIVFHAAAHKHVPLMEDSPCEAIKNNIFGTYNVAKAAADFKVEKVIILSTDKAVNPANVMGATKRVTELIIQYFDRKVATTSYAAVRFGNVLGSNGSVIPIFKKQIENGGPVTVTDPEITRYFMTIPEAAQLVIRAGSLSKGGEVFVLDMGEPVKILSLAENIIRLSGFIPYKDIEIKFSGLRPGEKLYEELTMSEELAGRKMTANNKIFVTPPVETDDALLESTLEKLKNANESNVRDLLKIIVPNFVQNEK